MNTCRQCQAEFRVTDQDRAFYKKMVVPEPQLCPDCRQQRRLAWRNERSLYRRKCDLSGQSIVSFYQPDSLYKVYSKDEWWSDKWDGLEFGRDYDFNRPFFEQFDELLHEVPHMAMVISHGENSDYCPYAVSYKDCYMCVSGVAGERIFYSYWTNDSYDCVDCYSCIRCQVCYECVQCINCNNSIFSKDCDDSNDLAFCVNCKDCKNCIGCFGLRHKEYCIFNEQVTKEEYEKMNQKIRNGQKSLKEMLEKSDKYVKKFPQRALQFVNVENCTGDYLFNCRNSHDCFLAVNIEDCAYCWNIPQGAKDCYDINYSPTGELIYNSMSAVNSYHCMCNVMSWDMKHSAYCFECFYGNDLFGCVGLKHQKYCILNKQYSKEDFKALKTKIIEQMKVERGYGDFFPISLSPYAYNETIAQDFFPLTEAGANQKGWRWSDYEQEIPNVEKVIPAERLPDNIKDVPDDILNWAITCEVSKKPFKIIPQELRFYREHGLPVPHLHPEQRYLNRLERINPRRLFERKCDKCGADIHTSFAPERPEKIYCEACYLKEVY